MKVTLLACAAAMALLMAGCATAPAPTAAQEPAGSRLVPSASSSMAGLRVVQAAQLVSVATGTEFIRNAGFGSMRPVFDTNSLLLVEKPSFDSLRVGDIVVYETAGGLVTHRIIERHGDKFWTMGDNNNRPDREYMTRQNFRYRVWGVLYSNDFALGTAAPGTAVQPSAASAPTD